MDSLGHATRFEVLDQDQRTPLHDACHARDYATKYGCSDANEMTGIYGFNSSPYVESRPLITYEEAIRWLHPNRCLFKLSLSLKLDVFFNFSN